MEREIGKTARNQLQDKVYVAEEDMHVDGAPNAHLKIKKQREDPSTHF
jgi:hypothetical protein